MLEQGEVLTLEDEKEYVVASSVVLDGINYVFLVNSNNFSNMMTCKFDNVDGLIEVDDPDLLETLLNKFNEQLNGPGGLTPDALKEKKRIVEEYLNQHSEEN